MDEAANLETSKRWQTILWILRVTVALQCLGNWYWMTQIEETPLLHWMLDPADIGGLVWSESTSLLVQQVVGWLVLVGGVTVLWRPLFLAGGAIALGWLTLVQLLITVAMWRIADGYSLQMQWIPPQLLTLFPLATQLLRAIAPLGLLLVIIRNPDPLPEQSRMGPITTLLRWSIAIVFLAHGIEAWQLNPKFLDLLIISSHRLLGISLSQPIAEQMLAVVGVLDILLSIACVFVRSTKILWWMAFWGAITAFSRVAAHGWGPAWHESFTRIPHIGIPLAVALWWRLLEYKTPVAPPTD